MRSHVSWKVIVTHRLDDPFRPDHEQDELMREYIERAQMNRKEVRDANQ